MGNRIIYFYKKENTCYRQKNMGPAGKRSQERNQERQMGRTGKKQQAQQTGNVSFQVKELGETIKVFFCGIPEYYGIQFSLGSFLEKKPYPRVAWNDGQLLRVLQNCCEQVSADAYYLEENFEKGFAGGELTLSSGRQRMCGDMIRKLTGEFRGIDSILYAAGGEDEKQGELPLKKELLRKLHYFFYAGEKSESYFILEDNLWQEYGMPLIQVKNMQEISNCPFNRLLLLDDRQEGDTMWRKLPDRCVYLDLWSSMEKQKEIIGNRTDIKYLSEYLYLTKNLDTSSENEYDGL